MKRVGLLDIDSHAKVKKWGGTIYPNLALCKIAAWHKSQGDRVEWAEERSIFNAEPYDVIYASKIFNFSEDADYGKYDYRELVKGGTGYDVTKTLPEEIDRTQPDYSIYPTVPTDTSYGFLTRGCPNKCKWCVVPVKEGLVRPYMDIDEVANGRKKIVLMDNNILAAGEYGLGQLRKIIERGYRVDFNQAMDARLVDEEKAELLAQIKWIDRRIRFGCDTTEQIAECERAIAMIDSAGYKGQYFLYTMIGYGKEGLERSYERIHHFWLDNQACIKAHKQKRVYPYAQPYRDPFNPNAQIPKWQKDMAGWCNKKMVFEVCDFKDFEPRKGFKCREYFNE